MPSMTPENRARFQTEQSPIAKMGILHDDFNHSKECVALDAFLKHSDKQKKRIDNWIPAIHRVPRFGRYYYSRFYHQDGTSYVTRFHPGTLLPSYVRKSAGGIIIRKYIVGVTLLGIFVTALDALLLGVRRFIANYTERASWEYYIGDSNNWTIGGLGRYDVKLLWIYDPERLQDLHRAFPKVIFENPTIPIVGDISYSPVVLFSTIIIGLIAGTSLKRIAIFWGVAAIPVAWFAGLGVIPAFRLWILTIGLTCLVGALTSLLSSHKYLRHYGAARTLFDTEYWPSIRRLKPEARKEDKANRRKYEAQSREIELIRQKQRTQEQHQSWMHSRSSEAFDRRVDSSDDFRAFLKGEEQLNREGMSGIPGVASSIGRPSPFAPTLAELIENQRLSRTTPAELASAANISLEDAADVLDYSPMKYKTLRPELHSLYDAFHHR